jgi:catechol 2,3-dioxygenase-like lactoylglutathione lyase family enzyme
MPANLGQRVPPCLLVSDMRRTLDFYAEVLGFTQTGYYPLESDPTRTEVRRDGIALDLYTEPVHIQDAEPKFTGGSTSFRMISIPLWKSCAEKPPLPGDLRKQNTACARSQYATRTGTS